MGWSGDHIEYWPPVFTTASVTHQLFYLLFTKEFCNIVAVERGGLNLKLAKGLNGLRHGDARVSQGK
jgi:hypothetical protein